MKKREEQINVNSTLSKARQNETLFILRGQDMSAPKTIINWVAENIYTASDKKLKEALECALDMRRESLKNAD